MAKQLNLPGHKVAVDIISWARLKNDLEVAKERELEARLSLVKRLWPAAAAGTHLVDLGKGYALAAEIKESFKLDPEKTRVSEASLRKLGSAGKLLADRLFNWRAELRVGEFKKLDDRERAIVAPAVTITPSTPSLELREPKG